MPGSCKVAFDDASLGGSGEGVGRDAAGGGTISAGGRAGGEGGGTDAAGRSAAKTSCNGVARLSMRLVGPSDRMVQLEPLLIAASVTTCQIQSSAAVSAVSTTQWQILGCACLNFGTSRPQQHAHLIVGAQGHTGLQGGRTARARIGSWINSKDCAPQIDLHVQHADIHPFDWYTKCAHPLGIYHAGAGHGALTRKVGARRFTVIDGSFILCTHKMPT